MQFPCNFESFLYSYISSSKNQEALIQELRDEINRLKVHTTTSRPTPNLSKGSSCKDKEGLDGICEELDSCKSLKLKAENGSVIDQITFCNTNMNYVCCSKFSLTLLCL